MNQIGFLVLRQMRPPLLVLISAYAIAVLGMVLVPGIDEQGNPSHMDFFHAFYFVSYMATTIGFGEIPVTFSSAQRLWTVFTIYLTVVSWVYAIGKLIALMQNPALRQALTERRFSRIVRRISQPFYLICGYGDTGGALVDALAAQHQTAVVIDIDPDRINELTLRNYPVYIPGLCADAGLPNSLILAGLRNPRCQAVVALTNRDEVNLHVAITSKLLNPGLRVICRAESKEIEDNMASFNTDHIIDPFEAFADRLFTALHAPCVDTLRIWLTGTGKLAEPMRPPHGLWVLCGYGRFGKALYRRLRNEGIETMVIEATPGKTGWPEDGCNNCVTGWGTEAVTLRQAQIEEAVGIVAGTDHDTNNLSILMTAGYLNPDLFMVTRQNRSYNRPLFEAIQADIVAQGSQTVADRIRVLLNTPLLVEFMRRARRQGDEWARNVITRLAAELGDEVPEVWEVAISDEGAPTVMEVLRRDDKVTLEDLLRDPWNRDQYLLCMPLFLKRTREQRMLPGKHFLLAPGDAILFCGMTGISNRMLLTLSHSATLRYIQTGQVGGESYIWHWLRAHKML